MFTKNIFISGLGLLLMSSHLNCMQQAKSQSSAPPLVDLRELIFDSSSFWFTYLDNHLKSLVHGLLRLNARREALEILRETFTEIGSETSSEMLIVLASALKNQKALILLMQAGLDDETPVETLLHTYASSGNVTMVRQLLASGIDAERTNVYGETAFYCAAAKGNLELVQALLSPAVLDKVDNRGVTPLGIAVLNGHLDVVRYVLHLGADRNALYRGKSLLDIARLRKHEKIVALLDSGAISMGAVGRPMAALPARTLFAKSLEKALPSADQVQMSKDWKAHPSPLLDSAKAIEYARGSHLSSAHLAVQSEKHGLEIASRQSAASGLPTPRRQRTPQHKFIANLKGKKEHSNSNKVVGSQPLSTIQSLCNAAKKGYLPTVKRLLYNVEDINETSDAGKTPLCCAAANDQCLVVDYLLRQGADVNKAGTDGLTPLHAASKRGYAGVVASLLRSRADLGKLYRGKTALDLAVLFGHAEVIKLLSSKNEQMKDNRDDYDIPIVRKIAAAALASMSTVGQPIHVAPEARTNPVAGRTSTTAGLGEKEAKRHCASDTD